jgi:hypothetical protein
MKHTILILISLWLLCSCNKESQDFRVKAVTINSYRPTQYPHETLRVRFLDDEHTGHVLGVTDGYPASLPLPAKLNVNPAFKLKLYKQPCVIELWGDSTGLIGSAKMNMSNYKIVFPLEMEVESENFRLSVSGKWDQQ